MVTNNELDKLLNQAGTTARFGSENHCRKLLLEIDVAYELARRSTSGSAAESLAGRTVSVDVSTCDDDAGHRIFAELTGETGSDGTTLIAIETSRNFEALASGSDGTAGVEGLSDREARLRVADALGLGRDHRCSFSWKYLLGAIRECAKDDRAVAIGSDGTAAAELPPLPKNFGRFNINGPDEHRIRGWTSEQMQEYGHACYAIGRSAAATSGSELAGGSVLDIAARIFDFKPHKQTEEVKAKYLCFANEVIAQQVGAPAQPKLTVWYGPMPESNGKSNFTAILMRKDGDKLDNMTAGITIDRSEYPDRVRYEADRVRYLIGELAERPFILDYDADKHSGYVAAPAPAAEEVRDERAQFEPFNTGELNEIEAVALAAPKTWYGTYQIIDGISDEGAVALIEACSPDAVLTLVAQARAAMSASQGKTEEAK